MPIFLLIFFKFEIILCLHAVIGNSIVRSQIHITKFLPVTYKTLMQYHNHDNETDIQNVCAQCTRFQEGCPSISQTFPSCSNSLLNPWQSQFILPFWNLVLLRILYNGILQYGDFWYSNKKIIMLNFLCFLFHFSNLFLLCFIKRLAHNISGEKSLPSFLTMNNLRSTSVVQQHHMIKKNLWK